MLIVRGQEDTVEQQETDSIDSADRDSNEQEYQQEQQEQQEQTPNYSTSYQSTAPESSNGVNYYQQHCISRYHCGRISCCLYCYKIFLTKNS
ncbi:MAG TPA: hypothetical protein VE130_06850 [Nitrososphaeraceae archaeon]|nr:hypothetical protein [Nitrososphaeraceae archaeon]